MFKMTKVVDKKAT